MRNWVIIVLIFVIPLGLYGFLDAKAPQSASNSKAQCTVQQEAAAKSKVKATGAAAGVKTTNEENMTQATAEGKTPKIIKFSSPMCSECVKTSVEMKKAVKDFKGDVVVEEMDVLKVGAKQAVQKYKVSLVPTLIFIDKEGKVVKRQEGFMSSDEIIQVLDGIK